jgi:hypothetical protein
MLDRFTHFSDGSPRLDTNGCYLFQMNNYKFSTGCPNDAWCTINLVVRLSTDYYVSLADYFTSLVESDDKFKSQFIMSINEIEW